MASGTLSKMNGSTELRWNESNLPLDRLLTEGEVTGCIALLSPQDKPPAGCAGMLDWRTHGAISASIRAGAFSGAAGECAYFPWSLHGQTRHILLIGTGDTVTSGPGHSVHPISLAAVEKNLKKMGSIQWGISRSEFPEKTWIGIARSIPEGGSLWISA